MSKALRRVAWCLIVLAGGSAAAHPTQFTTLQVIIEPSGRFQATLNIDLLSYALGKTSLEASNEDLTAALNGPRAVLGRDLADAGQRFRRELVIHTDAGEVVPGIWQLPGLAEVDAVLARKIQPPILMPGEISFAGILPAQARHISVRLPFVLGDTVQVYELPHGRGYDEPVAAGGYCSELVLQLAPPIVRAQGQTAIVRGTDRAGVRLGIVCIIVAALLAGGTLLRNRSWSRFRL